MGITGPGKLRRAARLLEIQRQINALMDERDCLQGHSGLARGPKRRPHELLSYIETHLVHAAWDAAPGSALESACIEACNEITAIINVTDPD